MLNAYPELSLRSNSGLKLANAFGVFDRSHRLSFFGVLAGIDNK